MELKVVGIDSLHEHEGAIEERVQELFDSMSKSGVQKDPITISKGTNIILDGHHRYNALKRLGCTKILVFEVDYYSDYVKLTSWRKGMKITKDEVIDRGLSGNKFKPKTSRHIMENKPKNINYPLERLK